MPRRSAKYNPKRPQKPIPYKKTVTPIKYDTYNMTKINVRAIQELPDILCGNPSKIVGPSLKGTINYGKYFENQFVIFSFIFSQIIVFITSVLMFFQILLIIVS